MTEIGAGRNYRIAVDPMKNRMHTWYVGEFMRTEDNPRFLDHTKEACGRLKPGFTVLADMVDLKMMGLPDVAQLVQATLLDSGVARVAAVWSKESFSKLVVDSSAQKVGESYAGKRKSFASRAEAEAWLDRQD